jgi:hypothetical protein
MNEKEIVNIRCEDWESECEYCGKKAELRPYGKNGANICYSCGMKNEKETRANFNNITSGKTIIIDTR